MTFTKEDIKRIANNLVYIRKAYGCETQLDFAFELDPDGQYPGLSYDMIKKYESGNYQITEKAVRLIASLTIFSFEDIVFGDLSDLEPGSLTFDSIDAEEIFNDKDALEEFTSYLHAIFPLFTSKEALQSKEFKKAYEICEDKLSIPKFKEEDVVEAIQLFDICDSPEASANILSLLGRLYVGYIYYGMSEATMKKLQKEEFYNFFDFTERMVEARKEDEKFYSEKKKLFLEYYNRPLTIWMQNIARYDNFKDYVYYYLGVRYYFGIMDNDITKFSDLEMNSFGINLLDCLKIIGNKYAKTFFEIIKK